jgi:hypothetical protein
MDVGPVSKAKFMDCENQRRQVIAIALCRATVLCSGGNRQWQILIAIIDGHR